MERQIRKQSRRTRTARTARTIRTARSAGLVSLLAILALLVFSAAPAFSHHKADHTQGGGNDNAAADHSQGGSDNSASDHDGDADSDSGTAYTEDTDNDGAARPGGDSESLHPSGNDRRTEARSSGNQGKSESDPDDNVGPMRKECSSDGPVDPRGGCTDKPNGAGGVYDTDQDGNNGCGNDQDFDDDNNGHCGKPEQEDTVLPSIQELCPAGSDNAGMPVDQVKRCNEDEVLAHTDFAKPKLPTEVLNETLRRAAPLAGNSEVLGAVLPFTGGSVSYLAAAALGLIALGTLALRLKIRTNE